VSDPSDDRIGSLIDERYQITEVMASGAMGAVYKAERVPHGKLVAIKFLHASFASDSEFQARFERETRVMSKLNHPNCVSVVDFGVWQGAPYLVMDYVDGVTLRSVMDAGPLPAARALGIARQILAGLAHAHQQDVFHRDVKPANIMLSEEIGHGERVRILDFGLARLQGNVGRDATQTNIVVGTPNYMAPEQTVPGSMIDGRTDLYAAGVVLFEMIAGRRPFVSDDTLQLLGLHRGAPIPKLATTAPEGTELPYGIQDVIDKAMAKSPKDRYQSAIEFAKAIDDVAAGKLDPMEIDATVPKMRTGPVSVVPGSSLEMGATLLAADASEIRGEAKRTRLWPSALLLLAGTGAMAAYLIHRRPAASSQQPKIVDKTPLGGVDARIDDARSIDSPSPPDATVMLDAPEPEVDAAVAAGSDEEEVQIDPSAVENPDQNAGSAAPEDEDENAPKSEEEVEKIEPPPPPAAPQLARTVHDAVLMIKAGDKELALTSLRVLWRSQPNSGYIPFLLGNLYFDKKWWSVALEHYGKAIKKSAGYKKNAALNKNVIRMLASPKTQKAATTFLRRTIGNSCKPYLRWAAVNEKNATVRKLAKQLAGSIR
jgi:serine/threonine-protein kinase